MNDYQKAVISEVMLACRKAHHELTSIDHNIGLLGVAHLEYVVLNSVKDLLENLIIEYYIKLQNEEE